MATKLKPTNSQGKLKFISPLRNPIAVVRFISFTIILICYMLTLTLSYPCFYISPFSYRRWALKVLRFWCTVGHWLTGARVRITGEDNLPEGKTGLFVCNHLSYWDIVLTSTKLPSCFVTSVEIRDTPFLGHICKLTGCLFVERRSRDNLSKEVGELTENLKQGIPVGIYPEATSTDGSEIRRFKRPLFQAAFDADVPVIPVTINYHTVNGAIVNKMSRDFLFWYGDMPFAQHYWNFMFCHGIDFEVHISPPIDPKDFADTTELSQATQQEIEKHFKFVR